MHSLMDQARLQSFWIWNMLNPEVLQSHDSQWRNSRKTVDLWQYFASVKNSWIIPFLFRIIIIELKNLDKEKRWQSLNFSKSAKVSHLSNLEIPNLKSSLFGVQCKMNGKIDSETDRWGTELALCSKHEARCILIFLYLVQQVQTTRIRNEFKLNFENNLEPQLLRLVFHAS